MKRITWLFGLVGVVAILAYAPAAVAIEPAVVTVEQSTARIRVRSQAAEVLVRRARLQLTLRDLSTRRKLTREQRSGGLFYERGGVAHELGAVSAVAVLADGVQLTVDTDEAQPATVTIRFLTARTVEVALDPPAAATVEALGERLRSPAKRGNLRAHRAPARLAAARARGDRHSRRRHPATRGRLTRSARRDGRDAHPADLLPLRAVLPVIARIRTRGRRHDVRALRSRQHRCPHGGFRFETGTTAESRRLVYRLLGRARVHDHPGRVHCPDRTADRPARLGLPALALARRAALGSDGHAGRAARQRRACRRRADVTRRTVFRPACICSTAPCCPATTGFGALRVGYGPRLPNPTPCSARSRRAGTNWPSGAARGRAAAVQATTGLEAQALGYLAPGSVGTPNCADAGGRELHPGRHQRRTRAHGGATRSPPFSPPPASRASSSTAARSTSRRRQRDIWADGRSGREVHNDYPHLQALLHHDALASAFPSGDSFLFTRSGYSGTAQWAIFWGGDIPGSENFGAGSGTDLGLRSAIISQQRAAFMGMPIWGSDTGGYYEFKDREVFARWLEFSCFSGLMEIGGVGTHAPWDMPTTPQVDPEMIDDLPSLHHSPPRVAAVHRGGGRGRRQRGAHRAPHGVHRPHQSPLARPLGSVPLRTRSAGGTRVAQRRAHARGVSPRGRWRNYFDQSQVFNGPRTITVSAQLEEIPVFLRDGAAVPGP